MKRLLAWFLLLMLLTSAAFATETEVSTRLSDEVLLSYYDNSIFFGDSIMQQFRRFRSNTRQTNKDFLENTTVIAASSISLYVASRRTSIGDVSFTHRGVKKTMYSIAQELKPDKAFILLGLNDPVVEKIEKAISWVEHTIKSMNDLAPGTEVYFFSLTPVTALYTEKNPKRAKYQELTNQYNQRLRETCEQMGAHYVDISEPLKGQDGFLPAGYSSDGFCHLSEEGLNVWVQALCDYAQEQYDLGLWTPAITVDDIPTDTEKENDQ